ncbi:putative endo-rhamnogalacturonase f [Phaeomoniella chlamydospora]|uniref:Putative endo-rhamnogalacturonase f n=1 Tax=Phaeomoniella chlamydospora TaxID=158046 RepID=A0A0G2EY63_PHACM|nr:putative endo-rhamnogalacturonase f [Phaeomoniella chlamydospora]
MPSSLRAFLAKAALSAIVLSTSTVNASADINKRSLGATTPLSEKSTVCNVLDYGGVADGETDIGPAITEAFSSCVSGNAATLYIPDGNYSLATGVTLSGASGWAFQIDGLITLTSDGSFDGNAFVIEDGSDIEVYSGTNTGAINGQGYITRRDDTSQNARLMRFISVTGGSVHNIILVDSPTFHLVLNEVSNFEVYYITVRGPDIGGTDGIDLICTDNCYVHDFEVTNRDECVSVKTPSENVLIEEAYCNHSGGMSIGSLTADITDSSDAAAVSNITMRNIYVYRNTQMLMIKTFPGGDGATGYVKDSVFENFWAYDTTYALDIDQYWESHTTPNTGAVALSGLTFSNWTGTMNNGAERGAVVIRGSDIVPLQDITLEGFAMWTVNGDKVVNQCKNVYGTGECIKASTGSTSYTTSVTTTTTPAGRLLACCEHRSGERYFIRNDQRRC